MGIPRTRVHAYMKDMDKQVGFITLKMKYARQNGNKAGYETYEKGSHGDDLKEMIYKTPIVERV